MEDRVVFTPSAFKHHETETDIYRAIETKVYEGRIKGYDSKFAIIGFTSKGNPIEVMYNIIDNGSIQIFHAMKARKGVIAQLDKLNGG
ncbi:MAG: hypothetical protein LBU16_07080 [Treponema sp.]|jgi:hypothetical protein|nr:hypothetical protein [Treponema sp.]